MENKKFRILIDMDDTITNFLEEVINEYNKTYGTSHSIDEVTEWLYLVVLNMDYFQYLN